MSPSSTGDSPLSAGSASNSGRPFPLPSRDSFSVEPPGPQLGGATANGNLLKSPTAGKIQRTGFGKDGILGAAQKARNLSQSSDSRSDPLGANGLQKAPSDEGLNPLKRRNTEATVDYPRRRATIAVGDEIRERERGREGERERERAHLETRFGDSDPDHGLYVVRSLPLAEVALRRYQAEVQALYGARCGLHLPGTGDQA